jgi:hypothetical protein
VSVLVQVYQTNVQRRHLLPRIQTWSPLQRHVAMESLRTAARSSQVGDFLLKTKTK